MAHLAPFLAILVMSALVSDRGLAAARTAAGAAVGALQGLAGYLRALGRRYARLASASSAYDRL